jgi:hypothetical protein
VMDCVQVCVVTVFAKAFFGKSVADIGLANAGQYISDKYGHVMVRLIAAPSNGVKLHVVCCPDFVAATASHGVLERSCWHCSEAAVHLTQELHGQHPCAC